MLKHLGREGVAQLVTRCCRLAAELGRHAETSPRLELTAPVASCVTCFRYRPAGQLSNGPELDELNRRIQQRLVHDGVVFVTGGMLPSGFSLRPAIVSWRTSEDVALLAEEVLRLGDEL